MSAIDKFDLTGRVAVVTGGSRGLGREMVLAFAEQGADVVIASRKFDNCVSVAREVEELGRAALPIAYHAGEWDDCTRLADAVYERFGRCDVLVNNAGMSPLYPSVDAITEALYDKVMGVNLKGPFRLSALVGTRMREAVAAGTQSSGSIIFVSSIASHRPSPQELVYGAAKAGVNNLTSGLARTFGPEVRVNCIVPGPFLTDISKAWDMEQFEAAAATGYALGRGGRPDEIIGAALYLASDASSYTTGSLLDIDGGPR
ncbi:MAG: SDR family NAD(P)-dependent oxidoreductase [Ilumatobacter sp.]|jgi:NAD(P)-dependent dehydrogenase (short-subunit alcohol dehydrogenase family)|uniref:SDR family NAD(P)-dependent oxidoreductase n=1 Tax=Ilumatobacter sp. TaxID=1967498 RepID=UPI00391AFE88